MSYVALYRKFRPPVFDEVKGQEHIVRTLRNQVRHGQLQHAYLFCGTRGTGKTTMAKILARAVNCENPDDGNPCGVCDSCRAIAGGISMNVIEIDAASNNGVDNIREIVEEVQYRPTSGNYKVYIIDEVHMLSPGAFNALLKTLEEPPEYVIFILATTEAGKIPVTVLSRCQRYDFRRIDPYTIAERLRELADRENIAVEEKALLFLARAGDGSMRDALSLMDRCTSLCTDEVLTYRTVLMALGEADQSVFRELTEKLILGDAEEAVRIMGKQISSGIEIGQFTEDYIVYLRNVLIVGAASGEDAAGITGISEEQIPEYMEMASMTDTDTLMRYIRVLSDLQNRMRYASGRRVLTEIALIQLARPEGDREEDALPGRVRRMELLLDGYEKESYAVTRSERITAAEPDNQRDDEERVLPEAAPEDLRQICAEWKHLLASMPEGPLRRQLRAEAVPQFNADTMENRLYIEFRSTKLSEQMDRVLIDHPDYREELEAYLERRYGKKIEVEMHMSRERAPGLKTVDVDRQLMELGIEVEEE